MTSHSIPDADLVALADHVTRLKHDLGKYVRFQGRWLGTDATLDARIDALQKDLLHTRRGPTGSVDAQTVWGDFSARLTAYRGDSDVDGIFENMAALAVLVGRLPEADEDVVRQAERASDAVAEHVRSLSKRVRLALASAERD